MITYDELIKNRQKPVTKLLQSQFKGPEETAFVERSAIPEDYVEDTEACLIAQRNKPMLWRLFKLYGLNVLSTNSKKHFYKKEALYTILSEKKPKGMKAVGLGNIHKALIFRLSKSNIEFEKEKRFEDFSLPFDAYLPKENIAIEVQGPQHFFLSTNWTGTLESAHTNLYAQMDRDNQKIKYCKEHNIDLVWITVDSDVTDFFEYLKTKDKSIAEWFHRGHLEPQDWDNNFEKWLLYSYDKEKFLGKKNDC